MLDFTFLWFPNEQTVRFLRIFFVQKRKFKSHKLSHRIATDLEESLREKVIHFFFLLIF